MIIGAGSIVSKNCEDNSVYAGNPAKRICSIDEMYKKRKSKMLDNAKNVVISYYKRYGTIPDKSILREYQMIFDDRSSIPQSLDDLMRDSGCYEKCIAYYKNSDPMLRNYDDFLNWCNLSQIKE